MKRVWTLPIGCCLAALVSGIAWADPVAPTLPTLALDPAPAPSVWSGLYIGTEVFGIAARGGRGGVGGGVFGGYDHEFANSVVLGVQGSTGYSPAWTGFGRAKGFDYAATDIQLGYDMGRLTPFVTAGVVLLRPHFGLGGSPFGSTDSLNAVMGGPGEVRGATRVGVGATYAVTNNLSVGLAVSAVQGRGLLVP